MIGDAAPALMPQRAFVGQPVRGRAFRGEAWCALGLLATAIAAYTPLTGAGFVYDDATHLSHCRTMTYSLASLLDIWRDPSASPQYYPVTHTLWWLQYQLWGLRPLGYHMVNVGLHVAAALLLARLLHVLGMTRPAVWLAAALFTLHPVQVESAGYVSELKNVLSTACVAGSALLYWRGGRRAYIAALLLFAAALLAKTVAASLPAVLVVLLWWKHGRVGWRDVRALAPMFVMGAVMGAVTVWLERHHVGTARLPSEFDLSPLERCLLAGWIAWFYVGKFLRPWPLMMNYPRWEVDAAQWWQWSFPLAWIVPLVGLALARQRIGRGPMAGVLAYGLMLFPALGFVDVYPFRFSYVADHYQYPASTALAAMAAAVLNRLGQAISGRWTMLRPIGAAGVVTVLMLLTWRHAGVFIDEQTLWRDTVEKNPASWLAHAQLAAGALTRGDYDAAEGHIDAAIALRPDLPRLRGTQAEIAWRRGHKHEAVNEWKLWLQRWPQDAGLHLALGRRLAAMGHYDEALAHCERAVEYTEEAGGLRWAVGATLLEAAQPEEAAAYLHRAIADGARDGLTYAYLGASLLMLGRVDDAIAALKEAARLRPYEAALQRDLAELMLRQGRVDEGMGHLREAMTRDPDSPQLRQLLSAMAGDLPPRWARRYLTTAWGGR